MIITYRNNFRRPELRQAYKGAVEAYLGRNPAIRRNAGNSFTAYFWQGYDGKKWKDKKNIIAYAVYNAGIHCKKYYEGKIMKEKFSIGQSVLKIKLEKKGLYRVLTDDNTHVASIVKDGFSTQRPWRLKHLNGMFTPYSYRTAKQALSHAKNFLQSGLL